MKKITTILLSAMVFGFVGCQDTDTTTNYPELPDNNSDNYSAIPEQSVGYGLEYDITGYFFPSSTLNEKGVAYKDYTVTTKGADGYFNNQKRVVKHYVEGNKNAYDESVITVFEDDKRVRRSIVGESGVTYITYDVDGNEKTREQYSKLLQVDDDLIRNENGACILKAKIDRLYVGNIIPDQADPHSNPIHYNSVLHFYCGTNNGTKIDRYYANGWGEVAEIYRYSDNSIQYVVFDRNSYRDQ